MVGYNTDQSRFTTDYTERAVRFIRNNKSKPFFLYLAHSMPHVPLAVSDKFKGKSEQGLYGDVMMEIDWSVGQVLKALEKSGAASNTIVVLTSDNGPWINYGDHAGSTGGLREGKGTTFEGGQRVPCIVWWPGTTPAGTICNQLASSIDLLPTFAEIAGTPLPAKQIDGVSIRSLFEGVPDAAPRTVWKEISTHILNTHHIMENQNNNNENQLKIELTPEVAEGTYANLAIITHSSAEVVLDFVRVLPGVPKANVKSRIILAPEHAKRLLLALASLGIVAALALIFLCQHPLLVGSAQIVQAVCAAAMAPTISGLTLGLAGQPHLPACGGSTCPPSWDATRPGTTRATAFPPCWAGPSATGTECPASSWS